MSSPLLGGLPAELRHEVWKLVLKAPCRLRQVHKARHRTRSRSSVAPVVFSGIALLLVCRQIHNEAIKSLYDQNLFRLTPRTLASADSTRFELLQYVDLDILYLGEFDPRTEEGSRDSRDEAADKWIARSISWLHSMCKQLKVCTVIFPRMTLALLSGCLDADSRTSIAMAKLKQSCVQERLEVILRMTMDTYDPDTKPKDFLLSIAPAENWSVSIRHCHCLVQVHAKTTDHQPKKPCKLGDPHLLRNIAPEKIYHSPLLLKEFKATDNLALWKKWPECEFHW